MILEIALELVTLIDRCMSQYQTFSQLGDECESLKEQLMMASIFVKGIERHYQTRKSKCASDELVRVPLQSLRTSVKAGSQVLERCSKRPSLLRGLVIPNENAEKLNQVRRSIDSAMIAIAASGIIAHGKAAQSDDSTVGMSDSFSFSASSTSMTQDRIAGYMWGLRQSHIDYLKAQGEASDLISGDPVSESLRALILDPNVFCHPAIKKDKKKSDECWAKARQFGLAARASSYGDVWAQFFLGWMHWNGICFKKDKAAGKKLFEEAAKQQHAPSYHCLGRHLLEQPDASSTILLQAASFFKLAAKQGHAGALTCLGLMYRRGQGVEKDHARALRYFKLAADRGFAEAQYNLGTLLQHGNPAQIKLDSTAGLRYLKMSAKAGFAAAQNSVGYLYLHGADGAPRNYADSLLYLSKAARQGNSIAQNNLGYMYEHGKGVTKDLFEAKKRYEMAAASGDPGALYSLGRFHINGIGVRQNKAKAIEYFQQAANLGHKDAQDKLSEIKPRSMRLFRSDSKLSKGSTHSNISNSPSKLQCRSKKLDGMVHV